MSDAAHQRILATAGDLEQRPRAEVIRGAIVEKAEPSFEHSDAQSGLAAILKPPFQGGRGGPGEWWLGTEVEIELETHEVYLPDVSGWRRVRVPERPRGRPIRIRPDWVAEVLSKSTATNDLGVKLATYHRAGVPHYWIIDVEHETLTAYRASAEGYVVLLSAGRNERVRAAPFEDIEIEIELLFGG